MNEIKQWLLFSSQGIILGDEINSHPPLQFQDTGHQGSFIPGFLINLLHQVYVHHRD